jgi:plastocyanin
MKWITRTSAHDALFWVVLALIAAVVADLYVSARESKRTFTVVAIEPKGAPSSDKGPFPGQSMVAKTNLGDRLPEQSGSPVDSRYVWHPRRLVVEEGDEVTIDFAGINGDEHTGTIAAFGQTFAVKRGEMTRVTFVADKVGIFGYVCSTHQPGMSGELIVLPKSKKGG